VIAVKPKRGERRIHEQSKKRVTGGHGTVDEGGRRGRDSNSIKKNKINKKKVNGVGSEEKKREWTRERREEERKRGREEERKQEEEEGRDEKRREAPTLKTIERRKEEQSRAGGPISDFCAALSLLFLSLLWTQVPPPPPSPPPANLGKLGAGDQPSKVNIICSILEKKKKRKKEMT